MRALILTLCLFLAACGGGGDDGGDRQFVGPPDCVNVPALCQ